MRDIRKLVAQEHGAVLVLTVILLGVLLGMAALAIDVGQMYIAKQRAQNVCDAGALAGGRLLNGSLPNTGAETTAIQCKDANNGEVAPWQVEGFAVDFPQGNIPTDDPAVSVYCNAGEAIRVSGTVHVNFAFAGIFGLTGSDIPADATAVLGPALKTRSPYVIPIGLPWELAHIDPATGEPTLEFGQEYQFGTVGSWQEALTPDAGAPGNWLALDLSGHGEGAGGMSEYVKRLEMDPHLDPVDLSVGDPIKSQPGAGGAAGTGSSKTYDGLIGKTGQLGRILQETDTRFEALHNDVDADGYDEWYWTGYNPDAWSNWQAAKDPVTNSYPDSTRIVVLPIIDLRDESGSTDLVIKGFAAFFVTRVWDGISADTDGSIPPIGHLDGYFIQAITSGSADEDMWMIGGEGGSVDNSYRTVRLIS